MPRLLGLQAFMEKFGTEDACWTYLREARWGQQGFQCPRCAETEHWGFIRTRKLFQCHGCGYQCSVTAGTIMQDTKLSLVTWFLAARLVLTMKKGITSHELGRQLGVKQETAWYLVRRLCRVVKRAYGRLLFGLVEVDETYVGGNRGKEGQPFKPLVVGMVEDKQGSAGDLVLSHVAGRGADSIDWELARHVDRDCSVVKTDGWKSYWGLAERTGFQHEMHKLEAPGSAHEVLPWVHIVFSNLKRVLRGVHTKASRGQLQGYLDLFAYRFNHRADLAGGFERGLCGLVSSKPVVREGLEAGLAAQVY